MEMIPVTVLTVLLTLSAVTDYLITHDPFEFVETGPVGTDRRRGSPPMPTENRP
jgi:hypothetical protein